VTGSASNGGSPGTESPSTSAHGISFGTAAAAIILLDAIIAFGLIGVGGDFPLSDDWSYAHAAREMCQHGRIDFLPWTGASLIAQAFYGSLLCRVFGFSFTTLRISTLILGALADVGVLQLVRTLGFSTKLALFAALVFALSPLRVNLGFTFMTDLPFACFAIWAAVAYARGLRDTRRSDLLAGAALAAIALLIRQHGLFVAAAASLLALASAERTWRDRLSDAFACAATPALAFVAFHAWLYLIHGAPSGMTNKATEAVGMTLLGTGNVAFRALMTTGILLFPVSCLVGRDIFAKQARALFVAAAVFSGLWTFSYYHEATVFPYLPNVLRDFGVGALTLRDTHFLGLPAPHSLFAESKLLGLFNGGFVVFSTALLGGAWIGALRRTSTSPIRFVLVAGALLALGSLLHASYYFDRYLLPILPFAIVAALVGARSSNDDRIGTPAWAALALVAFFSVAGTHDYMAWNRARDTAVDRLLERGVGIEEIDAGMEFGGWNLAAELDRWPNKAEVRIGRSAEDKSWWWVIDDRYVVSMQPLPGYSIYDEEAYSEWLVPGTAKIYVLERAG
jgi:4-amino-4-deoxy-L-arabinose transferase-like glycosyltransferase